MNKWTCRAASMRTRAQVSFWSTTPGVSPRFVARSTGRGVIAKILVSMLLLAGLAKNSRAGARQSNPETSGQLKKLSLAQLGDLEVTTVSKEPVTVARTPAAIYVLTQDDIRLSGATSIPEVLRLVPGVEVARIDSDKWSIGVRGFGSRLSRSVLVLLDGRTVYTPLFAGVYWEVQDTLLSDIDRIEVIRGPGGTIWGANAVNAVINIITKSAKDTHGMLASIGDGAGEVSGGNLLGRWKRTISGGSDVQLQTYYDRTNRREASFGESRDTFDIDFLHHLILPGRQDFLWGLGARLSSGNVIKVTPTIVFAPGHRTDKLYSGFVQDEIPIVGEKLSITVGSKFLHNIYTGFEIQPSARLLWTPTARQTIWAGFTRAVRTPSRVEEDDLLSGLVASSPLTFLRVIGDGKFTSEHLLSYEAGYRTLLSPTFHFDVAMFYNNYDHLLSLEPGAPFSETSPSPTHLVVPFSLRNGLMGTTYGIEIAPDWKPADWWRLQGSYSFLHMDISKSAGSLDSSTPISTEGSSPQHQVVLQSFLELTKKLEFGQTYRYVSALPAQVIRSYSTADVRLGWHPARSFEFSVVGQNLFQPHHAESKGDPGPLVEIRRDVNAKITWRR